MPSSNVATAAPASVPASLPVTEAPTSPAPLSHFPTATPATPVHSPSQASNRLKSSLHLNALVTSLLALTVLLSPKTTTEALQLPSPALTLPFALALASLAAAIFKAATKHAHSRRHVLAVAASNLVAAVLSGLFLLLHAHKLHAPAVRALIAVAVLASAFAAAHFYFLRASSHPYTHANTEIVAI